MARSIISIDVYSDLACPWCYVGKKRLDKALEQHRSKADFQVHWHPYMIDPNTRKTGEEYLAYNQRRWGGDGWTQSLRRSGKPDGTAFSDWKWWPNTLQAHRLVLLADRQGKAPQAEGLLFEAIYERGLNVSDDATLSHIGEELGLSGVQQYLQSAEGREEVLREDRRAKQELEIHGVPCFFIGAADSGQKYRLEGAQPIAAFTKAFSQIIGAAE